MKAWFEAYPLREQLALLLMAAVIVIYILVLFVFRPLGQAKSELAARNVATAEVLQRVDVMAAEIRSLRNADSGRSSAPAANLSATLNDSANRYQLRVSRLQPNSRGAVQLRFESAPLEALLRWLHDLESRQGLLLEELSLSQTSSAGVVSATVRVAALN
jgi:type II secretory pathway component PulM